jgi:N-methylhydantoinase A
MRIGIDIGGTFTDFVFFDAAAGQYRTFKVLSTPAAPDQAVLEGLSDNRGAVGDSLSIVHGSTVATNALLERKGAVTALITTNGFQDVLEIGRQNRPDIYNLFSHRPVPLVPSALRFGVTERVNSLGQPIVPLDSTTLSGLVHQLKEAGVESVAVSLLYSFLHQDHEARIGEYLRQAGLFVSLSSEVLPEFREYERTSTTVINAYVSPILDRYLARLEQNSGALDFRVMQSNGGSISADQARREAVRCVLSGPAGGVVGARYVAKAAGFSNLLTFDMGGTSTDVSLCKGDIEVTTESEIGGLPLRVPVIDIHTVGSGGGSIAFVDAGGALRVGPRSAGADPGPICYGKHGQQPTVTDANLILGRIPADLFLNGQMELNAASAQSALTLLATEAGLTPHLGLTAAQTVALGIIEIANAHMERALRVISVQRGHDPRDFTLVSFGGAGGLHATALARNLGIPRVLVPPGASTLSAFGMLAADVVKDYVQTVMCTGDTPFAQLQQSIAPLVARGQTDVAAEGVPVETISLEQLADMRYRGQSYELTVPFNTRLIENFHAAHARAFGHSEPEMPVEIVNLRVRAVGQLPAPPLVQADHSKQESPEPFDHRPVVLANGLASVPFYHGQDLLTGQHLVGPAVVVQPDTTIFLTAGDGLYVDSYRNLVIEVNLARSHKA